MMNKKYLEQLSTMLDQRHLFHTDFQIDHFVIERAGISLWGMYVQALRELSVRLDSLRETFLMIRETEIDVEEDQEALKDAESFRKRRIEIKLIRDRLKLESMNHSLRETRREFNRFASIALTLHDKLGDVTQKQMRELEVEHWTKKFANQISSELELTHTIGKSTLESLAVIPPEMKERVKYIASRPAEERFERLGELTFDVKLELPALKELACVDGS